MTALRKLIWIYLLLLVFEGALRKWIVPALDAPLLIVRDPLVILIYFQAWRNQLSFRNAFFMPNLVLAVATAICSTLFGWGNVFVTVYGLRTDFLQIPLIFLIPQILDRDDVIRIGKFLLYVSIPMAALTILQFRSPQDSLLNKGAMPTPYGSVRPSGTFSFISGLSYFFTLTSAFVMFGYIQARTYKIWLLTLVTFAILAGSAVSGSRGCLVSIGLVTVVAILCVIVRGKGGVGIMVAAVLIAAAVGVLSSTSVFKEGTEQMQQRIQDASVVENGATGFVGREFETLFGPLATMAHVPFFGYGLGIGTNAGYAMVNPNLPWVEEEWARLIFECGPIFGFLLCLFRVALTLAIAKRAFDAFRQGNILPMILFAACGLLILNGQWGVPANLGFAIFGAGLVLAACEEPPEWEEEDHDQDEGESDHSETAETVG